MMRKMLARLSLTFLILLCLAFSGCAAKVATVQSQLAELAPLVPDPHPTAKPVVVMHGDTDFTERERVVIESAAKMWRLQTNNVAVAIILWDLDFSSLIGMQEHVDKNHHMVMRTMSWAEDVRDQDRHNALLLAYVYPRGGIHNPWGDPVRMKFVMDRLDDESRMFQVAVHELGHVFGVPHVETVQSVMYPSYFVGKTSCLKKHDLVAFCNVNECGGVTMFPCE